LKKFAIFATLCLGACAELFEGETPAIYVPPELEERALEWNDVVELPAEIIVSDVPLGPGVWLENNSSFSGWVLYNDNECSIREAKLKNGHSESVLWYSLTGAVGGVTAPRRIGTALPPDESKITPTRRIDEDQLRHVRQGWNKLIRKCGSNDWSPF